MGIVPAGVHDPDLAAQVSGFHFGGEGDVHPFNHRQPVHIRAQGDNRAGLAALQDAYNAGMRDTGLGFDTERPEVVSDVFSGFELPVAEFRILVNMVAPSDYLLLNGFSLIGNGIAGQVLSLSGEGGQQKSEDQCVFHTC